MEQIIPNSTPKLGQDARSSRISVNLSAISAKPGTKSNGSSADRSPSKTIAKEKSNQRGEIIPDNEEERRLYVPANCYRIGPLY